MPNPEKVIEAGKCKYRVRKLPREIRKRLESTDPEIAGVLGCLMEGRRMRDRRIKIPTDDLNDGGKVYRIAGQSYELYRPSYNDLLDELINNRT